MPGRPAVPAAPGTVADVLFDLAASRADHTAVDDLTTRRTWGELADRAVRIVRWLQDDLGIGAGDHVALVMGNQVEFVELALAAVLGGFWVTPVNWHLAGPEIAYILEDSGARVVIADGEHESLADSAAGDRPVVVVGEELDRLLASAGDRPPPPGGPPGGSMFYTSGTTGRPKGVRRAVAPTVEDQFRAMARAGAVLGLDGAGPHLVTGPLYHAAPVGFALMDLMAGAPLVVMPRFDAAGTLRLIVERGVRDTHLVPTMCVRLLRLDDDVRGAFDPTSLRTVLHGAAPIAPSVKQQMIEWWGPLLVEYWGASEGGVVTLVGSHDWLDHPGTVGRPTATHEVFATDADGRVLAPGETGALWCRNLAVDDVFAYHNDPDRTAAAFLRPGTYSIGDIGRVDADGYVYLADRASNMIISGGVNIYPAEVERVLAEHPAVADVAVLGVPDDEWGESVQAVVELEPGRHPDEVEASLLAHARRHLARFKVPRYVDFTDDLPRQPNGKLYTRVLKERYPVGRDRRGDQTPRSSG